MRFSRTTRFPNTLYEASVPYHRAGDTRNSLSQYTDKATCLKIFRHVNGLLSQPPRFVRLDSYS